MAATDQIIVVLMGEPRAWARARLGKRGVPFTPGKQRDYGAALRLAAQEQMAGRAPFDCPLHMELRAELPIPRSWSKKKQEAALRREILPTKKPDLSNLTKIIEDAWNGVIYRDDALIVSANARKIYSRQPKVVVGITPIGATL